MHCDRLCRRRIDGRSHRHLRALPPPGSGHDLGAGARDEPTWLAHRPYGWGYGMARGWGVGRLRYDLEVCSVCDRHRASHQRPRLAAMYSASMAKSTAPMRRIFFSFSSSGVTMLPMKSTRGQVMHISPAAAGMVVYARAAGGRLGRASGHTTGNAPRGRLGMGARMDAGWQARRSRHGGEPPGPPTAGSRGRRDMGDLRRRRAGGIPAVGVFARYA